MTVTEPPFDGSAEFACQSCGQPVARSGDRCPECSDAPTVSPPVAWN